jgi:hypothetical protein
MTAVAPPQSVVTRASHSWRKVGRGTEGGQQSRRIKMQPLSGIRKNARHWTVLLAATAVAAVASMSPAKADEAQAKAIFKAMSDYVSGQKAISFKFDSVLDVVTAEHQKLGLASSGTVAINRPDKIHATRTGGFADVEFAFDGNSVTLLGRNANAYAKVSATGSIDQLVDELRDKYHRPLPAADLLMSNPYEQLMPDVTDAKDLGSGVIRGVECDHLAFRTSEVDWQIWIAQGSRPYPCRYVITSSKVAGAPSYTIDVTDWKAGAEVASDSFSVTIPANAKQMNPADLPDFDEMAGIFKVKVEN